VFSLPLSKGSLVQVMMTVCALGGIYIGDCVIRQKCNNWEFEVVCNIVYFHVT
jgi:hypothetical protein